MAYCGDGQYDTIILNSADTTSSPPGHYHNDAYQSVRERQSEELLDDTTQLRESAQMA